MKAENTMTKGVVACEPGDSVAYAVQLMWHHDCGVIPVVAEGIPVGIVTDRDIAVALSTSNARASELHVGEMMGSKPIVCRKKDSLSKVLKKMAKFGIRRLPVVSGGGKMLGLISLADIIRASEKNKKLRKRVYKTMIRLARPHPIVLFETIE